LIFDFATYTIACQADMLARRHCANGGSEERERRDDNFTPLQLHSLARRVIYMHGIQNPPDMSAISSRKWILAKMAFK